MYDVVTITVNYKMRDDIVRMLETLKPDVQSSGLRILSVVVDNDSGDGIGQYIRENFDGDEFKVEFIDAGGNLGFGRANNMAMKRFDSKYYFLVNPDVIFESNGSVIQKLYNWMELHSRIGMIGPKLMNFDGTLQYSCYRFADFLTQPLGRLGFSERWQWIKERHKKFHMKDFDHNKTMPVDWIMGSAMFARAEAIKEVGGFDDRYFMYFEDCDWCRRLWRAGWPVYYVHDIVLKHGHRRASAGHALSWGSALKSILKNKITRIHLKSWLKYFWKWRGERVP